MKRRKSKKNNNEDYEDDVFVMELKKDSQPANFTSSKSPDLLISEVRLFSGVHFLMKLVLSRFKLTHYV